MTSYLRIEGCLTRSKGLLAAILLGMMAVQATAQPKHPARPATPDKPADSQPAQSAPPNDSYVLVGAGDIASCKYPEGAEATAKLIEKIPGAVFAAGDLAYEHGSAAEFKNCYTGLGASSKIARGRHSGIMNMPILVRRLTFSIGANRPGRQVKATTVTNLECGTSWC